MHRNRSVKRYSGGMPIFAKAHENRPNWISPKATRSRNMKMNAKKIRKGGKNILPPRGARIKVHEFV
jgi:hypothetical protein